MIPNQHEKRISVCYFATGLNLLRYVLFIHKLPDLTLHFIAYVGPVYQPIPTKRLATENDKLCTAKKTLPFTVFFQPRNCLILPQNPIFLYDLNLSVIQSATFLNYDTLTYSFLFIEHSF